MDGLSNDSQRVEPSTIGAIPTRTTVRGSQAENHFSSLRRTWVDELSQNVLLMLSTVGLREEPLAPGHRRIRWKNASGKWLYDDYVENEEGAVQALEKYLAESAYKPRNSTGNSPDGNSARAAPASPLPSSPYPTSESQSGDVANQTREQSEFKADIRPGVQDTELGINPARALHLLCSNEKGRYSAELHQELITDICTDQQLFRTLQRIYRERRGKVRPFWSLRTVRSIHFMAFGYGGPHYVDVRCHVDYCHPGKRCKCLPPIELVTPQGTEYECRPLPAKQSPPVGPQLMIDFFRNPDTIAQDSTMVIQQLPKRTGGELRSRHDQVTVAWGIYYKESWDLVRLWWILVCGGFLPSLIFGILWGVFAFAWWISAVAVVTGLVGEYSWEV